jgi:hypothetical protein
VMLMVVFVVVGHWAVVDWRLKSAVQLWHLKSVTSAAGSAESNSPAPPHGAHLYCLSRSAGKS